MKWSLLSIIIFSMNYCYSQSGENDSLRNEELRESAQQDSLGCNFVAFQEYTVGMKFVFPARGEVEFEDKLMQNYTISKDNGESYKQVFYHQIVGKEFTIKEIQDAVEGGEKGYVLLDDGKGSLLRLSFSTNLENLKAMEDLKGISLRIPYAVSTDEVAAFSAKYFNTSLYAKFLVNGTRFQKIKIIGVSAGSQDAPVHIVYQDEKGKKGEMDVCLCGINVLPSLFPNCNFLKFFSPTDPRQEITTNDRKWALIRAGQVETGMSKEEVIIALGKPAKAPRVRTMETDPKDPKAKIEKITTTMVYKNYTIILEDDIVISIQSTE